MAYLCNACGNLFSDSVEGRGGYHHFEKCPKCESDDIVKRGTSGTQLDYNLMPHRILDKFDWDKVVNGEQLFYKLSTVVSGTGKNGKDKVVLHVPSDSERTRTELWIVDPPFKPYFFLNEDDYEKNKEAIDILAREFGVGSIVESDKEVRGTDKENVLKIEFSNEEIRKRASKEFGILNCRMYEVMSFARRIYIDLGLTVKSLPTKLCFDIETDSREQPTSNSCNQRITLICAKDETGKEFTFLLEEETDRAEEKLLKDFFKLAFQYSTCYGYYTSKFDIPYSQARADFLGISWRWEFINCMDMHNIYSKLRPEELEESRLDLDTVGQLELGIGKVPRPSFRILYDWYKNEPSHLIEYCKRDVDIVVQLDKKYDGLNTRLLDCNLAFTKPDMYVTEMPIIESILYRELFTDPDLRMVVPTVKKKGKEDKFKVKYTGAMVKAPSAGIWDWVLVIDFRSMYNRIMQTWNIGIDTLDDNGDVQTAPKFDSEGKLVREGYRFTSKRVSVFSRALTKLEKVRETYLMERNKYSLHSDMWNQFEQKQKSTKVHLVAFYGVTGSTDSAFYDKRVAESITLTGQDCLKRAIDEAENLGLNVIYGDTDSLFVVFPSTKGDLQRTLEASNFLCGTLAQVINDYAREHYNVQSPKIDIDIDKIFTVLYLTDVKKRYAGWMLWKGTLVNPQFVCSVCGTRSKTNVLLKIPERNLNKFLNDMETVDRIKAYVKTIGCVCPNCSSSLLDEPKLHLYIAGFESKRTDWTKFAKVLQTNLFEMFLDRVNRDYIMDWVKNYVREMYLGKHDSELSYTKPIRRKLSEYKANAQHVRAGKEWEKRSGRKLALAQYITYYVLDDKGTVFPLIEEHETVKLPRGCYDYIAVHQIFGILSRLGFGEYEIENMTNSFQKGIEAYL